MAGSSLPRRHLAAVDPDTGEILDRCPGCAERDDQIRGLERDLNAWRLRYADLARDKERDAELSDHWEAANRLMAYWRERCNHPRSRMSVSRFELIEPFLRKDGEDLCRRAIDGAAYDPFVTTRKNGTQKRHDGWDLIFRDRAKFEEFCNRAPLA